VKGLRQFRAEYEGQLWVQVMLVGGLNDSPTALSEIAAILETVSPDQVHLTLPTRLPAEPWLRLPTAETLAQATAIFGEVAQVAQPSPGHFDLSGHSSLVEAIISIITRHPMREDELLTTLSRWPTVEIQSTLTELEASGQAKSVERLGHRFWGASPAYYPASPN
jgi:wyosine [tRNA(Phe)-imidazoG37] synthetase (radical SAM superfamily)